MQKLRQRLAPIIKARRWHHAEGFCHAAYFCGVAWEGHGLYQWAGGAMAIFALFSLIGHAEE
jgi:hypothetical protein